MEDPPAIPNEMVFQEGAASSSYRLRIEVFVTRASPDRVVFKTLQRGGSQEAKCKLPGIAFSGIFMQSPGAEERFVQAVRLASFDLNVKTGVGKTFNLIDNCPEIL